MEVEDDARREQALEARLAAARELDTQARTVADRLRDLVRFAGTVAETDARAQLGMENTLAWKAAKATLLGQHEIKFAYKTGTGTMLTWIGYAA